MAARLLLLSWLGLAAGQATAGLLLRPKELQKIKGSLGRISDEVHSILGVLEESNVGIEAAEEGGLLGTLQGLSEQVERRWIAPAKAPPLNQSFADASAPSAPSARWAQLRELGLRWWQRALHWGEKMMWFGLFVLDVSVVIAMMLFLESLGRPRRKSRAARRARSSPDASPGTPIPAPMGRESSQWLAWLSQEELLAACLKDHWFKFVLGLVLAFCVRLPQKLLRKESLLFHLLVNVSMTLRVVGLALVLVRDLLAPPAEVARETVNVLAERGVSPKRPAS